MDRKKIPHDPLHLGVPSGASKTISEPMVRLGQKDVPILRQEWHYLHKDINEFPLEPHHLRVLSGAS
jgi:hypothetical protein